MTDPTAEQRTAGVQMRDQLRAAANDLPDPMEGGADGLYSSELASYAVLVQDMKAILALIERDLVTELGKREGKHHGNVADGRGYEVTRSADRKEWDHEEWQRDVRRQVVKGMTDFVGPFDGSDAPLVDHTTGEAVSLERFAQEVARRIQVVHGSTAPRTRELKALDLYASDYCTSTPGPWRLAALRADVKAEEVPSGE